MPGSIDVRSRTILALALTSMLLAGPVAGVAAGPTTIAPANQHLVILGDSLQVGAELYGSLSSRIERSGRWRSLRHDAVPGRTIRQGVRLLKGRPLPADSVLLVALGTNDMLAHSSGSYASRMIDSLMRRAGDRPVRWMTIEFDRTRPNWRVRGKRFNRELRRATARWPNLSVADWSKHFEPKGRSRYIHDGIHLTSAGYRKRANWTTRELKRWLSELLTAQSMPSGPGT